MNKMHQKASLSERAVQKVAKENVTLVEKKARGKAARKPNTKVKKTHWTDGVDPRVVKAIREMHIPQVWRRIQVVSPTEVIIHNRSVR